MCNLPKSIHVSVAKGELGNPFDKLEIDDVIVRFDVCVVSISFKDEVFYQCQKR